MDEVRYFWPSIFNCIFCDTLRDFVRTLEIANEEVSEVVELGWHIGVLGAVTHVT